MRSETGAMFAFLARHGLKPHENPFDTDPAVQATLMGAIVRGDSDVGPDFPAYAIDPTAAQALIMCRAVGVTPTTLRVSLSLGQDLFDAWLRGDKARLDDSALPNGVTAAGVRRLFGAMAFFIASSTAPGASRDLQSRDRTATSRTKELSNA